VINRLYQGMTKEMVGPQCMDFGTGLQQGTTLVVPNRLHKKIWALAPEGFKN
jgi:hypothetical protein